MNSKKRYRITEGATVRDIHPINDKEIKFGYTKVEDKVFYIRKLKNKLKLGNFPKDAVNDFDFLYAYESNPADRCKEFTLEIFAKCGKVEILEYTCYFTLSEAEWDLDQCTVDIITNPVSPYECIKQNSRKEFNILTLPNIVTTKADLSYNYEFYSCIGVGSLLGGACAPPGPWASMWLPFHSEVITYNDTSAAGACAVRTENITIYYREFIVTMCLGNVPNPPPGGGWQMHTNNCGFNSTSKYVRQPVAGAISGANPQISYGWYNAQTGLDELPPSPATATITVSNTPQCEDLQHYYNMVYPDPVSGMTLTFPIQVLNNPNSTYAWSLSPLSAATAVVTGTTNKALVRPTSSGLLKVRLTETHGNAYVSIRDYSFNVPFLGCQTAAYNISTPFTISKPGMENSEAFDFFVPENVICTGFTITNNWVFTYSNFNLAGVTGNSIYGQVTGGGSSVTAKQTFGKITGSSATTLIIFYNAQANIPEFQIPVSDAIRTIKNLYPNEPYTSSAFKTNSGIVVTLLPTWYKNNVSQGSGTLLAGNYWYYNSAAPATTGSFCLALKEALDFSSSGFGFQIIKIIDSVNQSGWGRTPPIYWSPSSATTVSYTRGREFKKVCEAVLTNMGCSVTNLVSDFFGWNPVGDAPGYVTGFNYVTGLPNKLINLTISQKSDVINPTSTNAATIGKITFEKLEKLWAYMFNAFWFIDPLTNKMRIEHISFFNKTLAYDTTVSPLLKWNKSKRKWSYDKSKMPKYEKFMCKEQMVLDFIGKDIWYDTSCVDQNVESNTKERFLDFLTTDLYALFLDPANADKNGFVLFCNIKFGVGYSVDIEQGLLSSAYLRNGHLSWANLHAAYHKHNRVLKQGYMNGVLTNFASAIPTKEQKNVVIERCCDDVVFNPQDILVKSELGNGIVSEAEESDRGVITMTLLHN